MNEERLKKAQFILDRDGDDFEKSVVIKRVYNACRCKKHELDEVKLIYINWRKQRMKDPLSSWFNDKKLPRKPRGISKETIEELYVNQVMSISNIAKELSISENSVYNILRKYDIPTRLKRLDQTVLTEERLRDMFVTKNMSAEAIAREFGTNGILIRKKIRQYNISR